MKAIVEAVTIAMSEGATLAKAPIEQVPVTSTKWTSAHPVKIVVGPNPVDLGCIAGDADGKCRGLDGHRKRGQGAAELIVEAVTIAASEASILARVPIEVVPVASKELASAQPVKIVVGPYSVDSR